MSALNHTAAQTTRALATAVPTTHAEASTRSLQPISRYQSLQVQPSTVSTSRLPVHMAISTGHPAVMNPPSSRPQSRPYGEISLGRPSSSMGQPFLGLQSLGQGVTRQVNQQRLASAAATLPRRPALSRRTRGTSTRPPRLATAPSINDCLEDGLIRVKFKVYPPQVRSLLSYFAVFSPILHFRWVQQISSCINFTPIHSMPY